MFRRCIRHAQALLKTKVTEGKGGGADQLSAASKQPSTPFAPHTGCDFSRSRAVSFHNHSGETFCPFASHGLYQDPRQRSSPPYPTAQLAHFATSAGPPGPDHPDQPSSQQDAQSPADHQQTLPAVLEVETDIDDDDSPPGPREMSLEEYDSVLDRWGELLQEGKLDETLDLMEYAYGGYDPLPPLEQMLAMVGMTSCTSTGFAAILLHATCNFSIIGIGQHDKGGKIIQYCRIAAWITHSHGD